MSAHTSEFIGLCGAYGEMSFTSSPSPTDLPLEEMQRQLAYDQRAMTALLSDLNITEEDGIHNKLAHNQRAMSALLEDLSITEEGLQSPKTWVEWGPEEVTASGFQNLENAMLDLALEQQESDASERGHYNRSSAPSPEPYMLPSAEWYIQNGVLYRPPPVPYDTSTEVSYALADRFDLLNLGDFEPVQEPLTCTHAYCEHVQHECGPTSEPRWLFDRQEQEMPWQGKQPPAWSEDLRLGPTGAEYQGPAGCEDDLQEHARLGQQNGYEAGDEMDLA